MLQALLRVIPFKVKLFVGMLSAIAFIINVAVSEKSRFQAEPEPEVPNRVPISSTTRIILTTNFCPVINVGNDHRLHADMLTDHLPWDILVNGTKLYHCPPREEATELNITEEVRFIQFRVKPESGLDQGTLEYKITSNR